MKINYSYKTCVKAIDQCTQKAREIIEMIVLSSSVVCLIGREHCSPTEDDRPVRHQRYFGFVSTIHHHPQLIIIITRSLNEF